MKCACAILPVASPALPHFSTFSHKRHDFRIKLLNIKYILILLKTFAWIISHSKRNSATLLMYIGFQAKFPIFVSHFNETDIFTTDSRELLNYKILRKSVLGSWVIPRGPTARHRDKIRLIVAFLSFWSAPKLCQETNNHLTSYKLKNTCDWYIVAEKI
jgi:hypothetical protein